MTDKQLKMQEAIMIAIHGSIEEAREKEYKIVWCMWFDWDWLRRYYWKWFNWYTDNGDYSIFWPKEEKIIWLPPTLSRVLISLGEHYELVPWGLDDMVISNRKTKDNICDWKLLNEDWSDATLFDQSEDTQDAIYNLLCW